jgi:hypothetical protein
MKRRGATAMGVNSIPTYPLERAALKIMHHASIIQMVKQIIQLFREMYTET